MKNTFSTFLFVFSSLLIFSGCGIIGEKAASMSVIYGTVAFFSLVLLAAYFLLVYRKEITFIFLFSSVFIVNTGYFFLSVSRTLEDALWANRLSYLGSVFLPMIMLIIIMKDCKIRYKRWHIACLAVFSILVFLLAASPGIFDVYYESVSLVTVNGVSALEKIYGPLHSVYLFYLLFYFGAMIFMITYASIKKRLPKRTHSIIIAGAVFINICIWLFEQLVHIDFELLSVSYIITELFLLGIHLLLQEVEEEAAFAVFEDKNEAETVYIPNPPVLEEIPKNDSEKEFFEECLVSLTPTEKMIFDFHLSGIGTKEIMAELCITENTIKFHNKNIYRKFGVSSKKQLIELCGKYIR